MNILVTGGAGFIGSNLAKRLISDGHKVFIIDNLSTGYVENIPFSAEFIEGDVSNKNIVAKLNNQKLDVIFHLSGQSSGEISFDDPLRDLTDNVASTLQLCDFMLKKNIPTIFYASSVTVYGAPSIFPSKETDMGIEQIRGFYGIGKIASENYLRLYQQNFGINQYSLRFQTVYGPGQNMNNLRQGMVSIFLELITSGQNPVIVKGSLDRFRDLIHIDDVVEICSRMLSLKNKSGVYNVGTGQRTSVREIIHYICSELNLNPEIKIDGHTLGDFDGAQADISKLYQLINYYPKIDAKNGIKAFAKWYQKSKA